MGVKFHVQVPGKQTQLAFKAIKGLTVVRVAMNSVLKLHFDVSDQSLSKRMYGNLVTVNVLP